MQNRIAEHRKTRGLTRAGLARALGVHRLTVIRWETGVIEIPLETLSRIARFFQVSPSDLIPELNIVPTDTEEPAHA